MPHTTLTGTPNARSPLKLDQENLTGAQLGALFSRYRVGSKDGLAFVAAVLAPCPAGACRGTGVRCQGGPHRLTANVTAVTALVVDLDHQADKPPAPPFEHYGWETYSHDPSGPAGGCYRLVFPFEKPLELANPDDWSRVYWPALMAELGFDATADGACRDPARLYYTPAKPTAEAVRHAWHHAGPLLDPGAGRVSTDVVREARVSTPTPTDPTRPVDLDKLREGLRRVRREGLGEIARALLQGKPLTPPPVKRAPGQPARYTAWRSATSLVANQAEGWEDSSALLALLRPSWEAEAAEDPADHTDWEKIPNMLESARANAPQYKADKEARRQGAVQALRAGLETLAPQRPKQAPGQLPGSAVGAPSDEDGAGWAEALQVTTDKDGVPHPKSSPANVELVLRCSDEWQGALRYNTLTHGAELWGGPVPELAARQGHALRDTDASRVADWFSRGAFNMTLTDSVVWSRMLSVAEGEAYDPLKDSIPQAAKWDGVLRCKDLFTKYYGAHDAPLDYLAALSEKFLIQLVARALRPGCQADTVVVLEGAQGTGKTTSLRILGGAFYTDASVDPHNKDSAAVASAFHIVELGELNSLRRSDVTALKQFVTKTTDDFRPPYGRCSQSFPRRCVFVGTTNAQQYLVDPTGNRRWWSVACGTIDCAALAKDREQLFAEARTYFEQGKQWHLTQGESETAEKQAEARMESDPVAESIEDWLLAKSPQSRPEYLRTSQICKDVLQQTNPGRGEEMKIAKALRAMKFIRKQIVEGGRAKWVFVLPESLRLAPKYDKRMASGSAKEEWRV